MTIKPDDALNLAAEIKPFLAGHAPELQGAALAELVATFFAGHRHEIREEQITLWLGTMRQLIEPNIAAMFPDGKRPPGWER